MNSKKEHLWGDEVELLATFEGFACPAGREAVGKQRVLKTRIKSVEAIDKALLDLFIKSRTYDVLVFEFPELSENQPPQDYIDHTAQPLVEAINETEVTQGKFINYQFGIFQAPFYQDDSQSLHRRYAPHPQYVCTANRALSPARYTTLIKTRTAFAWLEPSDMAAILPLPCLYKFD